MSKNANSTVEKSIVKQPGGDVDNIMNLIVSLCTMISTMMQTEINETIIKKSEISVRIYLNMVEVVNSKLRDLGDKPIWISKSNFMSLLNLPKQMKQFGPLRLYWEGGWKGEGIIQEIKCLIRDGLKKNWCANTLKRLYNMRAFDYMLEVNNLNYKSLNTDGNFKKYKSVAKVREALDNKNAISVIITTDYSHFICINKNECVQILKKQTHKVRNKMAYHYWSLSDKETCVPFPEKKIYGIMQFYSHGMK